MAVTGLIDLRGEKLPADVQPIRYEAREALSRPFEVSVELSTADPAFRVDECLRTPVLLTLVNDRAETRFFHGVVDRAEFAYTTGTRLHFRLRLRPAIAALARRENSRIFQETSVVDIIKTLFAEAGIDKVEWNLASDYEPRTYCVQYRESDLDFIHRLLEDEGIFYFFRHEPEGHTLVLADDSRAFVPADDAPEVAFAMSQGISGEPLEEFERTRSLRTTGVHLRDYDFEKPQQKPEAKLPAKDVWALVHYEYPGGFVASSAGSRRAKARIREDRRDAVVARGTSRAIGLRVGVPFTVDGAAQECVNGEYVVTELRTWGEQTLESGAANEVCRNAFAAIPAGAPWAPPRVTPRPRIRGIQTAIVTGASQDEQAIHTDKYGRIKVRFYWDRVSQQDDTSSCWLRVVQVPMGGTMILPRVGWEVAVAFLDGDPDRPFVLGRVYNAEKTPPYSLPGEQASGSLKSFSSPGGAGHNEIKLSDSGGSQGFAVHASKDLNVTILHDKTEKIGVDETHEVHVNMTVSVGGNEKLEVGANQSVDVGAVHSHNVGGGQTIDVGGNETDNATANYVEKIGGDRAYSVGGNELVISNAVTTNVSGNVTRKVGALQLAASVASISDNVGGNITENVGAVKVELVGGTSAEAIGGNKSLTSLAAELHVVSGGQVNTCDASVTTMVGGLHYQKVAGDYAVKAPMITLVGAIGALKGGGSELKLGGGPIVVKGSKIVVQTALLVKMGSSLKMGAG